ncbi:Stk1 family PASTA domain-containing Ser/Thr kinase [Nocardioides plantarum]|uniref:non-specific serine/threonine protein kinase n=1 Tax=Nocardioides plantarum TaxID=29299 RepID=A0ABV5KHY3_9ACTN|nr:Stk1 family PASTA domain-containing Ser/Thr kinase [Nocardioides plantarum]
MNDHRSDESGPTVVGGRYELGELLGRGGMAEVRKGTDSRLGRIVAVKRLRTDLASDATFQARFRREAQSSASLNHPSIVAVYDTGEEPATDGSGVAQPYIVMEYVAGRTLRDILREGRKILPERALEITSGVLSALDYSHRAGIIHRDIKPGNVMLTPSGDVKVMDFGIARAMSDAANSMTQTAAVVGTAQYLSPEQARGEQVDSRSDVYSAGCLLYELLTGRPPFVGDSPVAVAYQHVREQADPPSDHDTDLGPAVDAIVMKSLAKRLEDRYQSAAAMRTDIERYLAGRPVEAAAHPVAAPEPPRPVPVPTPVPAVAATPPRRPEPTPLAPDDSPPRTGLWLVLGLLTVALLIAGWFLVKDSLFPDSPETKAVPNVVGMTEQQARTEIGAAGFSVKEPPTSVNSDTEPSGNVIDQSPAGDSYQEPGTAIELTISIGQAEVSVPDVTNKSLEDAEAELKQAGFVVTKKEEESDEPEREILRQDPAGGTEVAKGTRITLFYSDGQEEVPDVVGDSRDLAQRKIKGRGFEPDIVEQPTDKPEENNRVVRQAQPPGTLLNEGGIVTVFVAVYTAPTTTSPPPSTPGETTPPPDNPPETTPPPP